MGVGGGSIRVFPLDLLLQELPDPLSEYAEEGKKSPVIVVKRERLTS